MFLVGRQQGEKGLGRSIDVLARLQLDYVDLYLIHAPSHPEQRLEQWRGSQTGMMTVL